MLVEYKTRPLEVSVSETASGPGDTYISTRVSLFLLGLRLRIASVRFG
jgi:hypothetical protein